MQSILDHIAPLGLLWLGAVLLDMTFGGRRALGAIPLVETFIEKSILTLRTKLERRERSKRNHFWRGLLAAGVLSVLLGAAGYYVNQLAFSHASFAALAVVVLAKLLGLKGFWQMLRDKVTQQDATMRRHAIEDAIDMLTSFYVPALLLFLAGGFWLLLPYYGFWAADRIDRGNQPPSVFLQPFRGFRSFLAMPGEVVATLFVMLAALLWPATNWRTAVLAALKPGGRTRNWPAHLLAQSLDLALAPRAKFRSAWLGPKDASAQVSADKCRSALIVALIAFAMTLAFLLVLLLAAAMG